MSGYVLCREGADALALFDDERVRFAASLDDGSGFVAFDGDALDLMDRGTVFIEDHVFPVPFPCCPKRAVATGREVYSLLPVSMTDYVCALEATTGVVQVTEELLLVESDGPISAGSSWQAGVVEFRDVRLELANA